MTALAMKLKVQLYCGGEIAMGPGKADLLEAIAAEGSISAGARALGMSYRRAWLLVDVMNRCWSEPLVATAPGGAPAGGARVTAMGMRVLVHYRALDAGLQESARGADWQALADIVLPTPRISQKA